MKQNNRTDNKDHHAGSVNKKTYHCLKPLISSCKHFFTLNSLQKRNLEMRMISNVFEHNQILKNQIILS